MGRIVELTNQRDIQILFGRYDENIKLIEQNLGIRIVRDSQGLRLIGDDQQVQRAQDLIEYLLSLASDGREVKKRDIHYALQLTRPEEGVDFKKLKKEKIEVYAKGAVITPKTKGQIAYVEAIKQYDVVFCIGPAGTGKTYLAMAMAVNALKRGLVRRIVLTRPAIEAGESLGFLPGDMMEKVMPYLRPLYDALYDMMEPQRVEQFTEQGVIEVAPLAFMRGRTLNDAFIILDEAQNSTPFQMKMFLTRLGFDSKAVITGDVTQSDLPRGRPVGLVEARRILEGIEGIAFVDLTGADVVRHELVQRIIEAYERADQGRTKAV